jgi:hypothetical protein
VTNPQRSTTQSGKGLAWCLGIGVALLALGALAGNGDKKDTASASSSAASSSGASSSSGSASSTMACVHFHNVMGDIDAGILADYEIREKVKEVRDSATTSAVRTASTDLLSAVTSGTSSDVKTATLELLMACA